MDNPDNEKITIFKGIPPISKSRYEEVCKYEWGNIKWHTFRNQESWSLLKDILLFHPNPIVRHEAAYMIGDFNIYDLVPALIDSIKYDKSIVAKHESAEALSFIKGPVALTAYNFLKDITENKNNYNELIQHEDVQVTALEALKHLEKTIRNQNYS